MFRLAAFAVGSPALVYLSRSPLIAFTSHAFYRFFECEYADCMTRTKSFLSFVL